MEQILNEGLYTINLEQVNTAQEIIFQLSSALDNEEARGKRICLRLGMLDLNQAQLLSIKSLINGIESTLSTISTKSIETEKTALSLGIIVSNISNSTPEIDNVMPYKSAEDFKEEAHQQFEENQEEKKEEQEIVEEIKKEEQETFEPEFEIKEYTENTEHKTEVVLVPNQENSEVVQEEQKTEYIDMQEVIEKTNEFNNEEQAKNDDVSSELDVIFGSSAVQSDFFKIKDEEENLYNDREELSEIVAPEQEYTREDFEIEGFPTKYIKQTIRSGQVINYEGNVVIIGDCHPGSEIIAFGDITVWGVLSGIAHAGSAGNKKARVRALKMNAIQLRIANCYSRRPDSLNTVFIEKTNSFTPEEARIINNEIVVFKIND